MKGHKTTDYSSIQGAWAAEWYTAILLFNSEGISSGNILKLSGEYCRKGHQC